MQPEPGLLHDVLDLGMVGGHPGGDAQKTRSLRLEDLRTVHGRTSPSPALRTDPSLRLTVEPRRV